MPRTPYIRLVDAGLKTCITPNQPKRRTGTRKGGRNEETESEKRIAAEIRRYAERESSHDCITGIGMVDFLLKAFSRRLGTSRSGFHGSGSREDVAGHLRTFDPLNSIAPGGEQIGDGMGSHVTVKMVKLNQ